MPASGQRALMVDSMYEIDSKIGILCMTSEQIAADWKASFGLAGPCGFLCREAHHDLWVRIHSLPESKRYPENEADRAEILRRHNTVASLILGENADCIVFAARFGRLPEIDGGTLVGIGDLRFAHVPALSINEGDESIQFFATQTVWCFGVFDDLILAAAENSIGPILFANLNLGTAYSPYDGGADLFLESHSAVKTAKDFWKSWLSLRADGR